MSFLAVQVPQKSEVKYVNSLQLHEREQVYKNLLSAPQLLLTEEEEEEGHRKPHSSLENC